MKKLLMDMKLINSEHMFNKILEDDNVKNQIYGFIESVGGIKNAERQLNMPPPPPPKPTQNRPPRPPSGYLGGSPNIFS